MKLSIIIPVYRVEATLDRCVESVLNQHLDDFEVILIDDGSPDNCPKKCDTWAQKDPHIQVIHQENKGLSEARNAGINLAKGQYITFVDSDDLIADHTYESLMQILAADAAIDILEYPVLQFYGSTREQLLDFPSQTTYTDMDDYWYQGQAYLHTYACNKIFRRELFDDIRFPQGRVFEDAQTLPRLLHQAHKVVTTSQGLYYYTANPDGITTNADGETLNTLLLSHVEIIRKSSRNDAAFQQYYLHILNIQIDVYELMGQPPILPYRHINPRHARDTLKLKAILLNILGIRNICKLIKLTHYVWRSR